jgi:hypothetical protein
MRIWNFGLSGLLILLLAWEAGATLPFMRRSTSSAVPPSFPVALEELATRQEEVARIARQPTLSARGPSEAFECRPEQYLYFLDHPDQAVRAWRRLGAKCVSITDEGNGRFGWADELGSQVSWETVYRGKDMRIWYAQGKVRPGPVLPMVPVEVVVILHHHELASAAEKRMIEHHADVFVYTDSKTAQMFARFMGTSTTRLAEQGLGQMQLFFSALCWYLDRHPDRARGLLQNSE